MRPYIDIRDLGFGLQSCVWELGPGRSDAEGSSRFRDSVRV